MCVRAQDALLMSNTVDSILGNTPKHLVRSQPEAAPGGHNNAAVQQQGHHDSLCTGSVSAGAIT